MPNWKTILEEITAHPKKQGEGAHDAIRRKYLKELYDYTGRNVIIYYSGWLQKRHVAPDMPYDITDTDKNGFMATIHGLDRYKGLDLFLHTPGGDIAATESIVDYLKQMFSDIRAIVPQLAMSAGTMIALACKSIIMGKHSNLGAIDPQFGGIPAHGVIEEVQQALIDIKKDPTTMHVWQPILAKYNPTFIGECLKATRWTETMVRDWLSSGMFAADPNSVQKIDAVMEEFGSHAITLSHARHISMQKAKDLELNIFSLESDQKLQDKVLSVHHACILTLDGTGAYKIIENHNGVASINMIQPVLIKQ